MTTPELIERLEDRVQRLELLAPCINVSLKADLTAAIAALRAAQEDSERLDWLEKNGKVAATYREMPPASDHTSGPYWKVNWTFGNEHTVTLRAAIDLARAREGGR